MAAWKGTWLCSSREGCVVPRILDVTVAETKVLLGLLAEITGSMMRGLSRLGPA